MRILIAGSFHERKGISYALAAVGRLSRELPIEVTVIGDATSERRTRAEKRRITRAIREYGLEDRVRLLGFRPHDELFAETYCYHIFLSPSVTARDGDTEGGAPVTIIEMAATGMPPVVSTTHCDISEVLPAITGLLAAELDVAELIDHHRTLVDCPEMWATMVTAARHHIEAEFDAAKQGALGRYVPQCVCPKHIALIWNQELIPCVSRILPGGTLATRAAS